MTTCVFRGKNNICLAHTPKKCDLCDSWNKGDENLKTCIFRHDENICIAITPKNCDGCTFYKSSKEYKRIYEKGKYAGVVKIESEGAKNGGL